MKKFLSLVLALVMTMSLVTVSAGAADFKDADSIEYDEAVEVLDLIGVMKGYPDGSFQPDKVLTRAEAAKIITALVLTPELADELTVDAAPFADVPADHWAAAYIAECVEQGILAGTGDGNFAPNAELTGYAYLKMLFCALGYDAAAEGLTGANWQNGVTKMLKNELDLTDGNSKFVGKNGVTREEAALYTWNAMNESQVGYEKTGNGMTITIGEVVIDTTASGTAKPTGDYWVNEYDLYTKDDDDAFGRDGYFWFVDEDGDKRFDKDDEEKTGTIAEKATEIFVAEKAYGKTEMVKFLEDNDLEDVKGMDFDEDGIAMGEVVELWIEKDKVVDYITYTYAAVEVKAATEMSAKKNSDEVEHGISVVYTFKNADLLKGNVTYVDAYEKCDDEDCKFCEDKFEAIGEWEKDDVILVTVSDAGVAEIFEEVESVYGELDSKKAGKYIVIDGEKLYTTNTGAYEYDKNYTVYVDENGYVVSMQPGKVGGDTEDKEYVYLLASEFDAGKAESLFAEGEDPAAKVKVMYLDGEIEVVDYCVFENEDEKWVFEFDGAEVEATKAKFADKVVKGAWYSYEEHDGMICLEPATATETLKVSDSRTWSVGRVDGETELVLLDKKGVYETYTGRADMPTEELKNVLVITEKGVVVAAYAYKAEWDSTEDLNDVAVLLEQGDDVKEGRVVTFFVGEEEVEYVVGNVAELNDKHSFYEILTEKDGVVTIAKIYAEDLVKGEVIYVEDEYVEVKDGETTKNFDLADDCEIYQLNKKLDSVTAIDELAEEDVVIVASANKKGDATLVYVFALNTTDGFTAKPVED